MRRYTTPTHELLVEGVDLTGCDVYATYRQGRRTRTIRVEPEQTEEGTVLHVPFEQIETAEFRVGPVDVQVNWVHPDGQRDATEIASVMATQNLLDEVVPYVGD